MFQIPTCSHQLHKWSWGPIASWSRDTCENKLALDHSFPPRTEIMINSRGCLNLNAYSSNKDPPYIGTRMSWPEDKIPPWSKSLSKMFLFWNYLIKYFWFETRFSKNWILVRKLSSLKNFKWNSSSIIYLFIIIIIFFKVWMSITWFSTNWVLYWNLIFRKSNFKIRAYR